MLTKISFDSFLKTLWFIDELFADFRTVRKKNLHGTCPNFFCFPFLLFLSYFNESRSKFKNDGKKFLRDNNINRCFISAKKLNNVFGTNCRRKSVKHQAKSQMVVPNAVV